MVRIFNRYYSAYDVLLLLGDVTVAVLATVVVGLALRLAAVFDGGNLAQWIIQVAVMAIFVVTSFYYSDLYAIDQTLPARELVLRLVNGFGVLCLITGAVGYLIPLPGFRKIYFTQMLLLGLGLVIWRVAFMEVLRNARVRRKVLIVGIHAIGKLVAAELCGQKQLGMEVVGFVGSKVGRITLSYGNPSKVSLPIFPEHSILGLVEREGVNRILVAGAESCGSFPAQELVALRLKGIQIEDCHTFYERLTSKISIVGLQPSWIILAKGFRRTRWILCAKRAIDMLVSAIGIILSAPISLVTTIAIKLDSPGPVLYRQERVGQKERPFTLYKFRSMFHDAEANVGPVWAAANDPRVTRIGRIIRKLRIDEIPQMINVLKGEMSFVGPRPERPFFVSKLKEKIPYYNLRFSVKPGITGWAQISYPYGDSDEDAVEKLQYDLYYIKNISAIFDLQIIFETLKVVFFGKGAQ